MKCKILILSFVMLHIFVMLQIAVFLSAQNNQFQFSHLDINNGLSHNDVTCIFKDNRD
jgi:hypothetical protein